MATTNTAAAAGGFKVIVHFATASFERAIATFPTFEQADRRAFEYTGADAKGVWVERPDGTRVKL